MISPKEKSKLITLECTSFKIDVPLTSFYNNLISVFDLLNIKWTIQDNIILCCVLSLNTIVKFEIIAWFDSDIFIEFKRQHGCRYAWYNIAYELSEKLNVKYESLQPHTNIIFKDIDDIFDSNEDIEQYELSMCDYYVYSITHELSYDSLMQHCQIVTSMLDDKYTKIHKHSNITNPVIMKYIYTLLYVVDTITYIEPRIIAINGIITYLNYWVKMGSPDCDWVVHARNSFENTLKNTNTSNDPTIKLLQFYTIQGLKF